MSDKVMFSEVGVVTVPLPGGRAETKRQFAVSVREIDICWCHTRQDGNWETSLYLNEVEDSVNKIKSRTKIQASSEQGMKEAVMDFLKDNLMQIGWADMVGKLEINTVTGEMVKVNNV